MKPVISIIMGSDSDLSCMNLASEILREFKVPFEVKIVSAHRTPKKMQAFALNARKRGIKVIIAGAGGAAHLPGMVASLTTLPVIGVPILTQSMKGMDSLLSIAQMPRGVPVASMAVGGSINAALMAIRILSLSPSLNQTSLLKKLQHFQKKQKILVARANNTLLYEMSGKRKLKPK